MSEVQQSSSHVDSSSAADASADAGRTVSVSEARRYRKRAQAAEQSVAELQQQLAQHTQALQEKEQIIDSLERRSQIDQLLIAEEAMDLGAARLLTEAAIVDMEEADVQAAVAELRRMHPYLFRQRTSTAVSQSAAMDSRSRAAASGIEQAAHDAHATGSRRDLLRYLRLRRRQ